jgi:fucose permease
MEYHVIKTYVGVEVQLHAFLFSVLNEVRGSRAGQTLWKRENLLPWPGIEF